MRLEILNRDDWACVSCGDKTKTLNVHHRYYTWGKPPWEYPAESLVTLCEDCHEAVSVEQKLLSESCRLLREFDHGTVRGFIEALNAARDATDLGPTTSFEFYEGAALFLGVSPDELMSRANEAGVVSASDVQAMKVIGREFHIRIRREFSAAKVAT